MSNAGNWCLIESDPGVFTELIQKFGVTGLQVEELWSLDKENFAELKPVYGLVFLFKWTPDNDPAGSVVQDSRLDSIFFARHFLREKFGEIRHLISEAKRFYSFEMMSVNCM